MTTYRKIAKEERRRYRVMDARSAISDLLFEGHKLKDLRRAIKEIVTEKKSRKVRLT